MCEGAINSMPTAKDQHHQRAKRAGTASNLPQVWLWRMYPLSVRLIHKTKISELDPDGSTKRDRCDISLIMPKASPDNEGYLYDFWQAAVAINGRCVRKSMMGSVGFIGES